MSARRRVAIGLVHAPVLGKGGETMVSTVTNLDVHDLARTARSYGASDYFVITPIEAQRTLVARICEHWTTGSSAERIPTRQHALSLVRPIASIEAAVEVLGGAAAVDVWTTAARSMGQPMLDYAEARRQIWSDNPRPVLLLFGTSWGLAPSVVQSAQALLPPIKVEPPPGMTPFNHLSVRAAAAITCDRLLG